MEPIFAPWAAVLREKGPFFKISIFEHAFWNLKKVPEVAYQDPLLISGVQN